MSRIAQALARLNRDLSGSGLAWALIGGLAVSARSRPRTTEDLDVVIAVGDDAEAERVVRVFFGWGYRMHGPPLEHVYAKRIATVRMLTAGTTPQPLIVDLMFASSGIEEEIAKEAETLMVLPGVEIPVARLGHLLALKTLANRPIDASDFKALLEVANQQEVDLARDALRLIVERGFHREKDLLAIFDNLREPDENPFKELQR